jgi:hypothetical protein
MITITCWILWIPLAVEPTALAVPPGADPDAWLVGVTTLVGEPHAAT